MPRRPPSSAGTSRPYTSGGPTYDSRDPQYTYGHTYAVEEEEEDSEDEDVFAFLPPSTPDNQQQHDYPLDPPHISFPSPTFDPYARYPAGSAIGPSAQYILPPPQSPPSTTTDSNTHNDTHDDQFRLRRMNSVTLASRGAATAESREVRVSLPGSGGGRIHTSEDVEAGLRRRSKQPESSIAESLSITPSMIDDDETSREGSTK